MSAPNGPTNGKHFLASILKTMSVVGGLCALIYLGVRVGSAEEKIDTVQNRLVEEINKAPAIHDAIEARTDAKLAQQRELMISKLDDIIRRLERIERAQ